VKPGDVCSQGEDFFEPHRRTGHREEKRESDATVLETDEATGGVLQFEIPILGVSLIQVLNSFGQVPCRPILQNPRRSGHSIVFVYAQRLGAIASNSWATLYATVTKPSGGTGQVRPSTLHVGGDVSTGAGGGRYDSQNAWEGRGFGRNGGANSRNPKGRRGGLLRWEQRWYELEGQLNLGSYNRFAARRTCLSIQVTSGVVEGLITNFHLPL